MNWSLYNVGLRRGFIPASKAGFLPGTLYPVAARPRRAGAVPFGLASAFYRVAELSPPSRPLPGGPSVGSGPSPVIGPLRPSAMHHKEAIYIICVGGLRFALSPAAYYTYRSLWWHYFPDAVRFAPLFCCLSVAV